MIARRVAGFRFLGFDIGLDPSWIFLASLVTWALAMGLFPFHYPGLAPRAYWTMGALGALGLVASVLVHDMSRAAMARREGTLMQGITLSLFGGQTEADAEPRNPKAELCSALAGPLASLILMGATFLILILAHGFAWSAAVIGVLGFICAINAVLVLFNLLPVFPLDGGRLVRAGIWQWKKNFVEATRLATQTGEGVGWAFVIVGALGFLRGNLVAGLWWCLVGLFLRGTAKAAFQQIFSTPADVLPPYEESHRNAA